eukprot:7534473-Pyramimonas_sp.AAC.1
MPDADHQQPQPVVTFVIDDAPGKAISRVTHYMNCHRFEAMCGFHGYRCRRTRSSLRARTAMEVISRPGKGRCVGELIAWVAAGRWVPACEHAAYQPPKADRRTGRNDAKLSQAGRNLLSRERAQETEPDSEPNSPF